MSFFGDFDIADAPEDPFNIEDGVYDGVVSAFKMTEGKRQSDDTPYSGLTVTLTPDNKDNPPYAHYLPLPNESDTDYVTNIKLSKIKQFLTGCGVPQSRMNDIEEDDIVGTAVTFKVSTSKPNKDGRTFRNVDVRLNEDGFAPSTEENTVSSSGFSL